MLLLLPLLYHSLCRRLSVLDTTLRSSSSLCLFSALPFVATSPIPETALQTRQTVNCTDLGANFDSSCWITLGLSGYLSYPETGWMYTTPNCTEDQSGANCCKPDQPWSTCYLRLAHGYSGQDCSKINPTACTWDPTLAVDPKIAAEVRYVSRNIYSTFLFTHSAYATLIIPQDVNNFFTTWWEALQFATTQAATIVDAVIVDLDVGIFGALAALSLKLFHELLPPKHFS